jgi:hypothetical protein
VGVGPRLYTHFSLALLRLDWVYFRLWSIMADRWYWNRHLCAKPWHSLFDTSEEVLSNIPTWIKLPNLPLDFWMDSDLKAIGKVLGTFITFDTSYKSCKFHSVAQILVALDLRQGLYESMELVIGDKSYTQTLDYLNVPFCCSRCHKVGRLLVDCELSF